MIGMVRGDVVRVCDDRPAYERHIEKGDPECLRVQFPEDFAVYNGGYRRIKDARCIERA